MITKDTVNLQLVAAISIAAVLTLSILSPINLATAISQDKRANVLESDYGLSQVHMHCDVTISSENVNNNAIQTAINSAHNGFTICLAAGTFPEQLTINKPIKLVGAGYDPKTLDPLTVIAPISVSSDATDLDTAEPQAPIILVQNTGDATIIDLGVNGTSAGSFISACGPDLVGIFYQNANGTIQYDTVTNVLLPTTDDGCQSGNSIFVQASSGHSSDVKIDSNVVEQYQKNGITCNDLDTKCDMTNNLVDGLGRVNYIAQNGIQVAFGASGNIDGNTVADNSYDNAVENTGNYTTATYMAGGILVYGASHAFVEKNYVQNNDIGIWIAGDGSAATPPIDASNNQLDGNYYYGITYDSLDGTASQNNVSDSPVGLLAVTYYNYNTTVNDDHNTYHNVSLPIQVLQPNPPYISTIVPTGPHLGTHGGLHPGLHHGLHIWR